MNKIMFGLILGGILGVLDGLTAWFTPEVRWAFVRIVIGQAFVGMIAGVVIGYFATRINSVGLGILFGLGFGLFIEFIVAYSQHGYYVRIMLPGAVFGGILGYVTQKRTSAPLAAGSRT